MWINLHLSLAARLPLRRREGRGGRPPPTDAPWYQAWAYTRGKKKISIRFFLQRILMTQGDLQGVTHLTMPYPRLTMRTRIRARDRFNAESSSAKITAPKTAKRKCTITATTTTELRKKRKKRAVNRKTCEAGPP